MIQLSNDCLVFQLSDGQAVPCSVERFTLELVGDAGASVDPEIIRNAATAVLHYFRQELNRSWVTLGEFTEALEKVLRSFGLHVSASAVTGAAAESSSPEDVADLAVLSLASGNLCELAFFNHLRAALREKLTVSPQLVRFKGLRHCAKRLTGARRWCNRSERMSDQIVDFMRGCLTAEARGAECALMVS